VSTSEELLFLIETFLSGANRSRAFAQEIEGLIIECFSDEAWFDDLSVALAQYAPGEGKTYLSEGDLAAELSSVAEILRSQPDKAPN
jgi:hypothetical protein